MSLGRLAGVWVLIASAAGIAPAAQAAPLRSTAHVYVLTGLLNMSPGLEQFAEKLNRSGIPASVNNHSRWYALATEAIAQYRSGQLRSIVIVGHSLGGGAALDMAAELAQANVPVNLVATIDPVGTSAVPPNVRRTVNYYVPGGMGSLVQSAGKSRIAVQNVIERDPAIGHFSIIAAHERELFSAVLAAARSGAPAAHAQSTPRTQAN
jgi:pimeloyl-ACP methyl ester carboxylesterase